MSARRRWMGLGVVLALVGCAPQYDTLTIRKRYGEPDSYAGLSGLGLRHGEVLVFEVHPQAVGDPATEVTMEVDIETTDFDIAVVRPSILTDTWAVNGARVGTTDMHIEVDGEIRETVQIEVEPEGVQ